MATLVFGAVNEALLHSFADLFAPFTPKLLKWSPTLGILAHLNTMRFRGLFSWLRQLQPNVTHVLDFAQAPFARVHEQFEVKPLPLFGEDFSDFLTSLNFCFKPLPWREFGFRTPTGESPGKELRCCWSWQDVAGVYHTVGSNGFRASFWLYYRTWLVSLVKLHFFTVYGMLPRA